MTAKDGKMEDLKAVVREFIDILETKEVSDNGREFHPITIGGCRCMKMKRISELIEKMKELS